jgi:hypothetical protein
MRTHFYAVMMISVVLGLCAALAGAAPVQAEGISASLAAQASEPGAAYNIYFGSLHNHSTLSDGDGSPSAAYAHARDVAGLDFFSLADHAENLILTWPWEPSKYEELVDTAKSF